MSESATPRRTAVVTGASSGIGAATARMLAAEGFHVFCAARRADRVEALADEIGGTAVVCDVTSEESVAALAERVGGRLDVLVNNAGGAFGSTPVAQADSDEWRRMYEVNVIGLMQVTRALLPALVASGAGMILNVGSTAGRIAYEGGAGYTAAKHGTKVVTETLRLELWDQPVRVCEIAPGMVRTDEFALVRFEGDREKAEAVYAGVAEPLTAEDVADAITWMVTRPPHVNVDELVIRPRAQAAQHKVHRVFE
ncbi:SDR family oxidoreductase [Nocardioides sp. IC4_145]|uniref:SDR family oxidoreductase n=1 Tax=Nocardioides sp. IC4_145 TaxID=2714037 RepID=UPI00140B7225|nr:SDR family oxidoreductase [Nocardioides sp. IC4_145]NHC24271.1 SDR family oxidoreductase [Nocardioides sp. IC4_145]